MFEIRTGDCLDVLRGMADSSFDSIVTDPPYGLSFMGKKWDYDVPSVEIWAECLRVLKPGGHLLAFAGTRTQHRMAVRIEDAGFEIRDMIAWVYGSGFPKSLDVSKAIDKVNGEIGRELKFTQWFRSTGVTRKQTTDAMVAAGHILPTGTMAGHYFANSIAGQPAVPTAAIWATLRPLCLDVPAWVDELVARVEAEREIVGQKDGNLLAVAPGQKNDRSVTTLDITTPATPAAQQWAGWGTALKPALEPITVARKPLVGTVAENVLQHGTGGINVDGCRVAGEHTYTPRLTANANMNDDGWHQIGQVGEPVTAAGRWPANLIHDGSEEPAGLLGSAARFFYCAKANKRDRGEGNAHPTVKPTELMRYLCRLVTPPGGLVLDPFAGSGSTGKGALLEGFRFLGIERDPEYARIAQARCAAVQPGLPLSGPPSE